MSSYIGATGLNQYEERFDTIEEEIDSNALYINTLVGIPDPIHLGLYGINVFNPSLYGLVERAEVNIGLLQSGEEGLGTDISGLTTQVESIQEEITGIQTEITGIQGEITGIQGEITAVESSISAIQLVEIPALSVAIGLADGIAVDARNKADRSLSIWNEDGNNVYHKKSGNVGIGATFGSVLNNKLEVNGNINIQSGSKYKINNVNLAFSDLEGSLSYNSLSDKPTLFDGNYNSLTNKLTQGTNITIVGNVINNTYELPTAGIGTQGILGGCKVDNSTITINNGVISSAGGTPQVNSDWTQTNANLKSFLQNKPSAGTNISFQGNTITNTITGSPTQDIITLNTNYLTIKDKPDSQKVDNVDIPLTSVNEPYISSPAFTETIRTFTHSGGTEAQTTHTITVARNTICDILIVGGGGGGGFASSDGRGGGGGGAGQFILKLNYLLNAGTYNIKTGNGGLGGSITTENGETGKNTSISTSTNTILLESFGGGGGARGKAGNITNGLNGASGGGACGDGSANTGIGGTALTQFVNNNTVYTGYNGANGGPAWNGGGGGGYTSAGYAATSTNGGDGGNGITNDITGIVNYYCAGGGGGAYNNGITSNTRGGNGGNISAGNGGNYTGSNGTNASNSSGSGGGGAGPSGYNGPAYNGGNGGSGIVIIKFKSTTAIPEGNPITHKTLNFVYNPITIIPNNTINMVSYRGIFNTTYVLTITGVGNTSGELWGTDIYTDDSSISRAAVHAGVIQNGETKTIYIKMVAGQQFYTGTTRNTVVSASFAVWSGSYIFIQPFTNTYTLTVQSGTSIQVNNQPAQYLSGNYTITAGATQSSVVVAGIGQLNGDPYPSTNGSTIAIRYSMLQRITSTVNYKKDGLIKYVPASGVNPTTGSWVIGDIDTQPLSQFAGNLSINRIAEVVNGTLPISLTSGNLPANRLDNIDMGKVATGQLPISRTDGNLPASRLDNIDMGKVATGQLDQSRLNNLYLGINSQFHRVITAWENIVDTQGIWTNKFRIQTNLHLNQYNLSYNYYQYFLSMSPNNVQDRHRYWFGVVKMSTIVGVDNPANTQSASLRSDSNTNFDIRGTSSTQGVWWLDVWVYTTAYCESLIAILH